MCIPTFLVQSRLSSEIEPPSCSEYVFIKKNVRNGVTSLKQVDQTSLTCRNCLLRIILKILKHVGDTLADFQ